MFLPEFAGPHDPLTSTRDRPGAARRTSSIDTFRFADSGMIEVDGRVRDATIDPAGVVHMVGEQRLTASLDPRDGAIRAIEWRPEFHAARTLRGCRVGPGFREVVRTRLGDRLAISSPAHHLLDDWPGATLVSGYALQRAAEVPDASPLQVAPDSLSALADICAGWATDASMVTTIERIGVLPTPMGPIVNSADLTDGTEAWHRLARLPAGATRRQRRLDLWSIDSEALGFETHFRDSYAESDDRQSVLHEYLVSGSIHRLELVIADVEAQALVLPWRECPEAIGSVQRLVGVPLAGLRTLVRNSFVGTSTCTHLNDVLRILEDLRVLVAYV